MTRCNHDDDCEREALCSVSLVGSLCALHLREWGAEYLRAEAARFGSDTLRAVYAVAAHALHESDVDDLDEEFRAELRKEQKP
jgi:hypothetical protein